ncbi:unnamed protein product [Coccothraustes coccothraustes]
MATRSMPGASGVGGGPGDCVTPWRGPGVLGVDSNPRRPEGDSAHHSSLEQAPCGLALHSISEWARLMVWNGTALRSHALRCLRVGLRQPPFGCPPRLCLLPALPPRRALGRPPPGLYRPPGLHHVAGLCNSACRRPLGLGSLPLHGCPPGPCYAYRFLSALGSSR